MLQGSRWRSPAGRLLVTPGRGKSSAPMPEPTAVWPTPAGSSTVPPSSASGCSLSPLLLLVEEVPCACCPAGLVLTAAAGGAGSTSAWPAMGPKRYRISCVVAATATYCVPQWVYSATSPPDHYRAETYLHHCALRACTKTESSAAPSPTCTAAPSSAATGRAEPMSQLDDWSVRQDCHQL